MIVMSEFENVKIVDVPMNGISASDNRSNKMKLAICDSIPAMSQSSYASDYFSNTVNVTIDGANKLIM